MLYLVKNIRQFAADKSGAVTVDWVALTAAVVVIGIGLVYAVFGTGADSGVGQLVTSLTDTLGAAATDVGAIGATIDANAPNPLGSGS